jgi:hypothetical protein
MAERAFVVLLCGFFSLGFAALAHYNDDLACWLFAGYFGAMGTYRLLV